MQKEINILQMKFKMLYNYYKIERIKIEFFSILLIIKNSHFFMIY